MLTPATCRHHRGDATCKLYIGMPVGKRAEHFMFRACSAQSRIRTTKVCTMCCLARSRHGCTPSCAVGLTTSCTPLTPDPCAVRLPIQQRSTSSRLPRASTGLQLLLSAALLLPSFAQVAELACKAVGAALRVEERAWLATPRRVASRADARQLCRARRRTIGRRADGLHPQACERRRTATGASKKRLLPTPRSQARRRRRHRAHRLRERDDHGWRSAATGHHRSAVWSRLRHAERLRDFSRPLSALLSVVRIMKEAPEASDVGGRAGGDLPLAVEALQRRGPLR